MRRLTIWFVLLFAVAVVAAATFGTNDGLASFYWGAWRLDVSLNLFLLVLIGTCFLIVAVIQALNSLVGLPRRAREWRVARRDRSGQAALRDALAQYFGGRYTRAQKSAQRALAIQAETPELAQDNEFTVLGHLLAAGSAHRLQNRALRDEELRQALAIAARSPAARSAEEGARLLAAEWALDDRDAPRALAAARRAAARRRATYPCAAPEAAGRAPRPAGAGGAEDGAPAGQAPGLLGGGRRRPAALARLRGARHGARPRPVAASVECIRCGRSPRPVHRRPGRERATAFGAAEDARAWLRPFFDRIADLGAEERAVVAEALARRRAPASAPNGCRGSSRPSRALPRDGVSPWRRAARSPSAASGARRGRCSSRRPTTRRWRVVPRRKAWIALAELAAREGDAARAAAAYEAAAAWA